MALALAFCHSPSAAEELATDAALARDNADLETSLDLADRERDAADRLAMTARVDQLLAEHWQVSGVQVAPDASDVEFVRRASLDLTGIIPTASEARAFLLDSRPDKRALLIDDLLDSPTRANHLANQWVRMLVPQDMTMPDGMGIAAFQSRLRTLFAENLRYDNLVADILTTKGEGRQGGPALFYTALEVKPEELASATSRIFLGVQIQCAQCHDHPFDHWKQRDFWSYAAFFARVKRFSTEPGSRLLEDAETGEVMLPETSEVIAPRYLDGDVPAADEDVNRRRQLALWIVSRENPYFARATVNRVWAQLFGRGLVEPVDDFSERNAPSHPELLAELANYFVRTGFDLRRLYQTLANTRAYQLSSALDPQADAVPPELFARMPLKALSAEQLFDCLCRASRRQDPRNSSATRGNFNLLGDFARQQFLLRFQSATARPNEFQAGIPQVLTVMNGPLVSEVTGPSTSGLLQALEAPFLTDLDRVELLTLSVFSRLPDETERAAWLEYLGENASPADRQARLGDLLWAQLNSVEFIFNH